MSAGKKGSKTPRSAKAERASFEKVISALEKESEAYIIPQTQSKLN
jgi:hypothetical protein